MRQGWDDYERAAERGPMALLVKVIIGLAIVGALVGGIGYVFGWFAETGQVVQDEFGPRAMLKKYEWFKDASANLDKKLADIKVYESRMTGMTESYQNATRAKWAREDREQYNVWSSEVAGVKASYNALAAAYNSQMAKFNWRFANRGELPPGATEPLPREYKPYVER